MGTLLGIGDREVFENTYFLLIRIVQTNGESNQ